MSIVEKFYSVVAETQDGTRRVLPVKSQTPAEAFRAAKEMPDVRRVGRVTEIAPAEFDRLTRSGGRVEAAPTPAPAAPVPAAAVPSSTAQASGASSDATAPEPRRVVPHVISGPRAVVFAPPVRGGEQPFKHLKPPPERPKPPAPPPQAKPAAVAPAPAGLAAAQPKPPADAPLAAPADAPALAMSAPGGREYRIVKSRRRDGLPYLLQRGHWQDLKGKRAFDVEWEKGFAERDQAEQHLVWVRQTESELADLQQSA